MPRASIAARAGRGWGFRSPRARSPCTVEISRPQMPRAAGCWCGSACRLAFVNERPGCKRPQRPRKAAALGAEQPALLQHLVHAREGELGEQAPQARLATRKIRVVAKA